MKDFSNASFPPETISIMKDAMDAAVATLPDPVSLAHVDSIAELSSAVPRKAREIPQLWSAWRLWNFKLRRGIDVQSEATTRYQLCLPIHAEIFSFSPGTGLVFPHYVLEGRHRTPAVPVKAIRCNARMALIVWRQDWLISSSRIGLIPCH